MFFCGGRERRWVRYLTTFYTVRLCSKQHVSEPWRIEIKALSSNKLYYLVYTKHLPNNHFLKNSSALFQISSLHFKSCPYQALTSYVPIRGTSGGRDPDHPQLLSLHGHSLKPIAQSKKTFPFLSKHRCICTPFS